MKGLRLFLAFVFALPAAAAGLEPGGFVESEQPFLRSALVVSEEPSNLVRRGVLVPLGHDLWTCFDPDLLRMAAVWKAPAGEAPLTMDSMAAVSYPDKKAKGGRPPALRGEVLSGFPELPGIGIGRLASEDPREGSLISTANDKVGPLPGSLGRWQGLAVWGEDVVLHYRIGDRQVRETTRALDAGMIERVISVGAGPESVVIRLDGAGGRVTSDGDQRVVRLNDGGLPHLRVAASVPFDVTSNATRGTALSVAGSREAAIVRVIHAGGELAEVPPFAGFPEPVPTVPAFPGEVEVSSPVGPAGAAADSPIASRSLGLPQGNPWGRAVRPTDLAFLSSGEALLTTLDGDVWRIRGIGEETAVWSRAASGLFEPLSIQINARDEVFVLGRDQITRLEDINRDGYFDNFGNASDAYLQTLHTRDYAVSLALADDGSFVIARSGLVNIGESRFAETSKDRGTVLRISPDGTEVTIMADGLRLPFLGQRSDGAIFVSDQQGNHVPSTPIHRIGDDRPYLGYEPSNFRKVDDPVEPLLWFPYQINRSASAFATLSGKGFPAMGDAFVHLSWSGRIFPVVAPEQGRAFAWKLPFDFDFPILGADTHPLNGRLYATGIGISGYAPQTPREVGLAEIRQQGQLAAPVAVEVAPEMLTVTFRDALPPGLSLIAPRPELQLWNIRRSRAYGSGHFRWDGSPGEHPVTIEEVSVSSDRKTVSLKIPPIFRSDIMRLRLHLRDTVEGDAPYPLELYAKPTHLPEPSSQDLTRIDGREQGEAEELAAGDSGRGAVLFTNYGCMGCHALDGTKLTGPPLNGIGSLERDDLDAYLRASILDPAAEITEGYEPSMPSFAGVIPDQELEHLVAYLKGLR